MQPNLPRKPLDLLKQLESQGEIDGRFLYGDQRQLLLILQQQGLVRNLWKITPEGRRVLEESHVER